ncbi:gamma-glutamylcyclotransferase family protein [Variovorax sp. VNK109]|uniref:gamma-glutamylcyclotransferase family protein n=1 Tax=Variovorax sp. VNK109 TaxID=3400919 RepID=UPI003BFEFB07
MQKFLEEPIMPEAPLEAAAARRHVFVYGTLRRGDDNDINRLKPAPVFIGMGRIGGTMYHLGRYPGVTLGGQGFVEGEVYAVTPELERVLDEIEELYPQQTNEYFKRDIDVEVGGVSVACFVYEINPDRVDGRPVIPGGDWVRDRYL